AALGAAVDGGVPAPDAVFVSLAPIAADDSAAETPPTVRAALHGVLGVVPEWLADERFASSRLVLVTRGAVAGGDNLVHAPV
ncbi:hypothetical protein, partial [Saccharothrix sp. ST-888]|uniref:hypothetical protein n=1 Tax=Saccharothrix sp. ST-888 TaxID=1427391 RepID=UPI0005EC8570